MHGLMGRTATARGARLPRVSRWALTAVVVLGLAGCGDGSPAPSAPTAATAPSSAPSPVPSSNGPGSATAAPVDYAVDLFDLTNAAREAEGLPALKASACARTAAEERATALVGRALEHVPMQPVLEACGTPAAGENLVDSGASPSEVLAAWMASPGHRNNIVGAQWTELGVACVPHDRELLCAQIFLAPGE